MPGVNVQKIVDALERSRGKVALLADGFVDEVWQIVGSRASVQDFTLYTRMSQYANRILSSGTGGVGMELVRKRRTFGGFVANTGCAVARLGIDTTLVGLFGKENLDPVFSDVGNLCRLISIDDPAVTHIFEFDDGKVMMSYVESLHNVNWKFLSDSLGAERLLSLMADSDIIGVGYWSVLPAFDEIVAQICDNLPRGDKPRRFFFDFADFRKNDPVSLAHTLCSLKALNERVPMTLSVNEHEAVVLFETHNQTPDDIGRPIGEKTEDIRREIGLDELVIHTPHYAVAAAAKEEPAFAATVFCENPVRVAGAGDTFNGGYVAASLAGLNLVERLYVANAAVGCYLRTAASPDAKGLAKYIDV